jgi:predicted nuclease of predicted toxin-antitoxin system
MKAAYLIDANLPFRVHAWQTDAFLFVVKINPAWDDEEIWKYARENSLVIVTKDKDFLVKQAIAGAPPYVVHVKSGNLKLVDFVNRIEKVSPEVESLLQTHTIINIYADKLEAIK